MSYGNTIENQEQLLSNWIGMCAESNALLNYVGKNHIVSIWIEIDNHLTMIRNMKELNAWFESNNIGSDEQSLIKSTKFKLNTDYKFVINNQNKYIRITLL